MSLSPSESALEFSVRKSGGIEYVTTIQNILTNSNILHFRFKMTEFKASAVAFEVQKSFANKFFSNKTVAKTLIDDTSSHLLDNLYLLLYVFVSILIRYC